jgi:hypothetical protein
MTGIRFIRDPLFHFSNIPFFQLLGPSLLTSQGKSCNLMKACGNNSAVECNLAKVEVAGSNPVSRSKGGIAKW